MFGFVPVASAPIADDAVAVSAVTLTANSIVSGAPAVASSTVTQVHSLTATAIKLWT